MPEPMPEQAGVVTRHRGMLALAGLALLVIALRGLTLQFDHSLNSIDGAMQTWFALDNLANGKQLGTEFQSYLGVTMIAALLPVHLAAGQTLFASTLAAKSMIVAGAFGGAYAIVWMLRGVPARHRWAGTIVLVFALYYAGAFAVESIGLRYPATFDPGVSLRPLRGLLAFAVLPVFVFALRRIRRDNSAVAGAWLGLAAGVGLLWSNDAGIPLVLAVALGLGAALHHRAALLARSLAAYVAATAAAAGAVLMLVTQGDPALWFRYNFRDVSSDQFWFFAPWDRSTRILGPGDLPNILRHGELLSTASLVVLAVCVCWVIIRRLRGRGAPVRDAAFIMVGASVVGTALIPQIGGHIGAEYNAITFVLGLCAPLIVAQRAVLRAANPALRRATPAITGVLVAIAAIGMVGTEAVRLAASWRDTDRSVHDAALGFYVTPEYAADLRAMRRLAAHWDAGGIARDRRLLSVYTSPLDIVAGVDSPQPVGSLIHALGARNRANFTAVVAQQQVAAATTIAPDYSGWEGWLLRANWPFFKALRDNYHPIARTDQHIVWAIGGGKISPSDATCSVRRLTDDRAQLSITSPTAGLASIRIARSGRYATGRAAMLTVTEDSPFTRKSDAPAWTDFPRYGVPNAPTLEVSAPVEPGAITRLTLQTLGGVSIGSARCEAKVYEPIAFAALPGLAEAIDAHLAQVQP